MDDCTDSSPPSQMFVENPFKCQSPKNPHMQNMQQRLETFQSPNWPRDRIASTPLEFAMAGFYYLGDKDRVKCWYCNGGLRNWETSDVVSHEHAKWYPLCEYLFRKLVFNL